MQLNIMSCDKQARSTYTYRWTKKEAVVFCLYVELTYMKKYSVLGVIKRNFMQLNRETFVNLLRCDAMHSAAIAGTRCPSVCLSRSWVAPKRIKISSKFLHHDCGSQAILVFFIPHGVALFQREPPNWGVECKGGMKNLRFSTNISLYLRNGYS